MKHEHKSVAKSDKPKLDAPVSMVASEGSTPTLHTPEQPPESEYKGAYRKLSDGFLYKHCVWPHPLGRDHKAIVPRQEKDGELIHTGLFWEGTEEEFYQQFRKE